MKAQCGGCREFTDFTDGSPATIECLRCGSWALIVEPGYTLSCTYCGAVLPDGMFRGECPGCGRYFRMWIPAKAKKTAEPKEMVEETPVQAVRVPRRKKA